MKLAVAILVILGITTSASAAEGRLVEACTIAAMTAFSAPPSWVSESSQLYREVRVQLNAENETVWVVCTFSDLDASIPELTKLVVDFGDGLTDEASTPLEQARQAIWDHFTR